MTPFSIFKSLIIILFICTSCNLFAQQTPPVCGTSDSLIQPYLQKISQKIDLTRARTSNGPMLEYRLGVNIDHATYLDYGGDIARIRRTVYDVFNKASAIFEEEMNIKLTVYHIHVWDKPEPYTNATDWDRVQNVLNYWTNERPEVRDAVVGMSNRGGTFYGLQRICTSNFPAPGQNFSVDVLCHELGHTLSSPHTHNCWWPGGPIDRCVALEGTSESCREGFDERVNGTIMSYCLGEMTFHPLCRNVIRNFAEGVAQADFKLLSLDVKPGTPVSVSRLRDESGSLSLLPAFEWLPSVGASRYRVQVAPIADFSTILEDTLVPQSFFRSPGLNAGDYFLRYQPQNTAFSAEWSQPFAFRVDDSQLNGGPPPLLSATLDSAGSVTGSFRALSGITVYQVQAYEPWWNPKPTFELIPKGTGIEVFSVRPEQPVSLRLALRYRILRNNQWSKWSDEVILLPIPTSVPMRSSALVSPNPILAVRQQTTAPTAGPVAGTFQIATDPAFKNLAFDHTFINTNAPSNGYYDKTLLFPELAENTTYFTRSNVRLKTGFQSAWTTSQFRTGLKDKRFTYLGAAHPVLFNAQGTSSQIRNMSLLKSSGKLFIANAKAGYYETSDLKTWKAYLPSTTNGKSPAMVSAFTAASNGTIYVIDAFQGTVQKTGDLYTQLPLPPHSGVSGIEDLFATSSGSLFYRNYTVGIMQFSNGKWISLNAAFQSRPPICLAMDNKERVWTITQGGDTWRFENNQWISQPRMPFWNDLHGITFDNEDNAYAYGNWGVMLLNQNKGEWEVIRPLFDKSIQKIVFDDQNRMWLAMYRWPIAQGDDFTQYGLLRYADGKVNEYTEGLNFLREAFEIEYFNNQLVIVTGSEVQTFDERQILDFEPDASYSAGSEITVKLSTNSPFAANNRITILLNNQDTGAKIALNNATLSGHSVSFTLPDTLISGQYTVNLVTTAPEITSNESRPFRVAPIGSPAGGQPDEVTLLQNTPNPAIGPSEIGFYLPQAAQVRLELFNARGQFVKQLADNTFRDGWNFVGTDLTGLTSGVYVYRLTTGDVVKSMKLVR